MLRRLFKTYQKEKSEKMRPRMIKIQKMIKINNTIDIIKEVIAIHLPSNLLFLIIKIETIEIINVTRTRIG